jgi:hypothetical protein
MLVPTAKNLTVSRRYRTLERGSRAGTARLGQRSGMSPEGVTLDLDEPMRFFWPASLYCRAYPGIASDK